MKVVENRCVRCAVPGYPCEGDNCSYRHTVVTYCDECEREVDTRAFVVDGKELCERCYYEKYGEEDDE